MLVVLINLTYSGVHGVPFVTIDTPQMPENTNNELETATFSMGWFWLPDARFGQFKGIIRTRVGYGGGQKPDPTYDNIKDHSEAVQIDYDPEKISYNELLEIFKYNHNQFFGSSQRERSIIFYQNEDQKQKAKAMLEKENKLNVEISPLDEFYIAENNHQKYYLQRNFELLELLKQQYPDSNELIHSTAAARLNAYEGVSSLTRKELLNRLDELNLDETVKKDLRTKLEE